MRELGRLRRSVYAWSFSAMCVSMGETRRVGGEMPVVLHALGVDLWVLGVRRDLERQEVTEVIPGYALELCEQVIG